MKNRPHGSHSEQRETEVTINTMAEGNKNKDVEIKDIEE